MMAMSQQNTQSMTRKLSVSGSPLLLHHPRLTSTRSGCEELARESFPRISDELHHILSSAHHNRHTDQHRSESSCSRSADVFDKRVDLPRCEVLMIYSTRIDRILANVASKVLTELLTSRNGLFEVKVDDIGYFSQVVCN